MFGTNKKDLEEQVITLKAAFETAETKIEDLQRSLKRQAEDHSDDRKKWEKERAELKDAEAIISKRFDDQKALAYKTMELEFKGKMQDQEKALRNELDVRLRAALDENFTKLKDSLSKLHEEGNAQTKFTEQIALKMMDAIKVQNIPKIEG